MVVRRDRGSRSQKYRTRADRLRKSGRVSFPRPNRAASADSSDYAYGPLLSMTPSGHSREARGLYHQITFHSPLNSCSERCRSIICPFKNHLVCTHSIPTPASFFNIFHWALHSNVHFHVLRLNFSISLSDTFPIVSIYHPSIHS